MRLACIVEGHGEVDAVPVLVRRIASEIERPVDLPHANVIRVPRSKLVKDGEEERAVKLAAGRAGPIGRILILVDADRDCPAQLGPVLLRRARGVVGSMPVAVVLAKHEFEAWFIAAVESLREALALPARVVAPADPEIIRGAKEWLHDQGVDYGETADQARLTALFDFAAAKRTNSFEKCYREIRAILT
ncbi:MAG: DUF4276 family protein [Planctomycetes bacterium]|nr:DUF4276 family protein [Planctomycetota bacterium]